MQAPVKDWPRCDEVPVWADLRAHFQAAGRGFDLRRAFQQDPGRFDAFSQPAPHLFADLSKNLLDAATEALLMQLARALDPRHRPDPVTERLDAEARRRLG